MNRPSAVIIITTISVSISFLVNSILIVWKDTRRTADEVAKIETAKNFLNSEIAKLCERTGGVSNFGVDDKVHCYK